MTQQFHMNHGHPDGDLMTSLLAYHWFYATRSSTASVTTIGNMPGRKRRLRVPKLV